GGISLIGSSCRMWMPAASSQRTIASISPISPMPQLRDEGMEKSGTSAPARRERPAFARCASAFRGRGGVIRRTQPGCNRGAAAGASLPSRNREPQQPRDRIGKNFGRRQQAHDDERLPRKVEEIPGMNEDAFAIEELEDELLFAPRGWHANDRRPAAFRLQRLARRKRRRDRSESRKIRTRALVNLRADRRPTFEQITGRHLYRRADRQKAVRNQLEAGERRRAGGLRPADDDPAKLHLRQARGLRQPAEREARHVGPRRDVGD